MSLAVGYFSLNQYGEANLNNMTDNHGFAEVSLMTISVILDALYSDNSLLIFYFFHGRTLLSVHMCLSSVLDCILPSDHIGRVCYR